MIRVLLTLASICLAYSSQAETCEQLLSRLAAEGMTENNLAAARRFYFELPPIWTQGSSSYPFMRVPYKNLELVLFHKFNSRTDIETYAAAFALSVVRVEVYTHGRRPRDISQTVETLTEHKVPVFREVQRIEHNGALYVVKSHYPSVTQNHLTTLRTAGKISSTEFYVAMKKLEETKSLIPVSVARNLRGQWWYDGKIWRFDPY